MSDSKLICLCLISFFSNSVFSKVPQLSSEQLGHYANQLNNSPKQVLAHNINPTISNVSYNQKVSVSRPAYRSTSYIGNSTSEQANESQNVKREENNWVVDLVNSKKPQQVNYTNFQLQPAQTQSNQYQAQAGRKATLNCVIQAARSEGVPLFVVLGIQSKERGENGQINASNDLGHFQINTQHFRAGGMFSNIDMNLARHDGCLNATLAARVLRSRLQSNGSADFWTKAAAYHSWTPQLNAIYRNGTLKNKGLIEYSMQWKKWLELNGINPN
ncbi:transglycosylase SLT domain-containing protein [Acinetobacter baumannii]|uniref:transglycosylase SLT domain-containing protein n=1 Tax=Acinetobacter baumannii TaxID=470 RepID=UPI003B42954F